MPTGEAAKKGLTAAADKILRDAMPSLQVALQGIEARLGDLGQQIFKLDAKVDNLRQGMYDKFEQNRDLFNQLGERIARVEGRLDEIVRGMQRQGERLDRQSDKMDQWIERVVKVEMTQNSRGKRAG